MLSVTSEVPEVTQCSCTLVGALHRTGVGGPVSVRMRGPLSAETGTDVGGTVVGARIVVVVEDVEVVEVVADGDVDVEEVEALLDAPLLHALSTTSIAIVVIEASRGRRTQRS